MVWRRWIWVEDTHTGHRFDADANRLDRLLAKGAVRVVEGYPVNEGPDAGPRPAKPRHEWDSHAVSVLSDEVQLIEPARPRPARKTTPASAVPSADTTEGDEAK